MAIINNNVQNVQFLRNQTPYPSREAAITAIEGAATGVTLDGTALLARYQGTNEIITLVGYVYVSGNTHDLTLIDIEGASANVQALREEINAKLGGGITSGNTATAQLQALSGGTFTPGTSSSADTSVEGAKAYAYDLIGTLDYTDTAVEGEYVSQVTQSDGVIAVTRVALPSSADTAEAKKVVIAVAEDKGQIEVTRGEISSTGETIVLTDNADGGVNFEVHYDGTTIIQDPSTKELKVAGSALIQYEGDDNTVQISAPVNNVRTVSSPLTIQKVTTGLSANVKEEYHLVGHSGTTIGAPIQIYKDSALLSVALLHADYSDPSDPVLPTYDKTNGWTDIDATAQTQANQALCYAYEDAEGEVIVAAVPVGSFINEQEFASGITWDSTEGKVRGVVDPTSETFLTVGANGFKLSGVQDAIDAAVEGLDATVSNSGNSGHVGVEIVEEDGKLVSVTVTEDGIASADDIEELSAKTITIIDSTNGSITVTPANAADGTKEIDLATDASKIQMSGFTSTDGVLSGITPASSVTEAFEEVDKIITENEEITSAALNDLDARIKTVSGDVETLTGSSLSGITVNGTAVTPTSGVAPLVINSTSAATESNDGKAIVVTTNNDGSVTLNLAAIDCGFYD